VTKSTETAPHLTAAQLTVGTLCRKTYHLRHSRCSANAWKLGSSKSHI